MCKMKPFRLLGLLITAQSKPFCFFSILLIACSGGIFKLQLRDEVREGWTPKTSRSRVETEILKEFYDVSADPMQVTVVLRARDGGSMHRLSYLNAAVQFYLHLSHDLIIQGHDVQKFTYAQICGPFCNENAPILYFAKTLSDAVQKGKRLDTKLTYPIARINNQYLHLQPNFYGVVLRTNQSQTETDDMEIKMLGKFTDILYMKAIMMTFRANLHGEEEKLRTQRWEMEVYEYCKQNFNNGTKVEVFVLSDAVVNHEVMEDGKKTTAPVFITGTWKGPSSYPQYSTITFRRIFEFFFL